MFFTQPPCTQPPCTHSLSSVYSGGPVYTTTIDYNVSYSSRKGLAIKKAYREGQCLSFLNLLGADLRHARLASADFSHSNLLAACLDDADLVGCNFSGSNLRRATFRGANLLGAVFSGSTLFETDFLGARFSGVTIYGHTFQRGPVQIQANTHHVALWDGFLTIGCAQHTYSDWLSFDDERIASLGLGVDWWGTWKPIIVSVAEATGRTSLPNT